MINTTNKPSGLQRLAFFSYGFRPFFLSAAVFAGIALPIWAMILSGVDRTHFLYVPREWHVHEMIFGFLPAVIAGFLFTAMPNWTDRPPIKGLPLMMLWALWLAGRLVIAIPWPPPLICAIVDGAFLIALAIIVWREIAMGKAWDRSPIGILISLYAIANLLFHVRALSDAATDLPERMALSLIILLLALIGGRVIPSFTLDYLNERGMPQQPLSFSRFDGASILLAAIAAIAWTVLPEGMVTGWLLVLAGLMNLIRLLRWYGWITWCEPLVFILHVGYGWLAMSLLILGAAILGLGLRQEDAVHVLTTGAVGSMTLAIMTRASLGHTGRPRHAGTMTVMIYSLVNLGALLRVFGPATDLSTSLVLSMSAIIWSSAYVLFAFVYGPYLFGPSLDEE
ncbi:NnrS family protein [Candidatus Nitrospira allomarina]|uniref:NnrS family protein n=1 Tax=Candidatus Nitrospira allomarina TaxID=3020900 RepID=A0AA96JW98_9BACT|nr:NnrS family protein [Candidatus Nitrospira allomarina]WNM57646.1 NnrS family protein [Candidatus Nitrospira allomarina]